jgi:hypothetical protein
VLASRFVFRSGSVIASLAVGSAFVSFVVSGPVGVAAGAAIDNPLLDRVSGYVERYYQRAQTLMATETVVIQPLARDMSNFGPARRVVNELRIEWTPGGGGDPRTIRQVVSAQGPRLGPADKPDCFDPRPLSPEPLAFLLPAKRNRFRFTVGRADTVDGMSARRISFEALTREPLRVEWQGKCGTIRTPGQTRGFVWVVPDSGEILRLDEHLVRAVNLPGPPGPDGEQAPRSFRMERDDTLIDYKRFSFSEPDETVLLPSRVESLTVIRNSAVPRVRTTVTLTDYRRFLTGGRVVQ